MFLSIIVLTWCLNAYSTAGAIILRISHGYEVKENNDPFVDLADLAVDQFSKSTATGAWMVDIMPSCKPIWHSDHCFQVPDYL
jgi:hypothetical protein